MSADSDNSQFAATRWSLILRSRGETDEARMALGELCEAYYRPVMQFLQREGRDEDAAREFTQEFFVRVLAGSGFGEADPERGRFRSYVLGALKHFLADQRKHDRRLKRGGGAVVDSLDAPGADGGPAIPQFEEPSGASPSALFDREWALAVLERALATLAAEFIASDKTAQFETLKPWLMGDAPSMPQADAARQLGLSEGALKVAIHRLRKRFREAVRDEVSQTLREPSQLDEEMRYLVEALASQG